MTPSVMLDKTTVFYSRRAEGKQDQPWNEKAEHSHWHEPKTIASDLPWFMARQVKQNHIYS